MCEGRSIICGGHDGNGKRTTLVYEYDRGEWRPLPPLNKARSHASCCYLEKRLFIVGGEGNDYNLFRLP